MVPLLLIGGALLFLLLPKATSKTDATGVSTDTVNRAVQVALAKETDPTQLRSFADSLQPDYPAQAAKLLLRANQLGPVKGQG